MANYQISSETLAACKEFSVDIFSDLYKEANGFRPRFPLGDYTAEQLDDLWVRTCKDAERRADEDETREYESEIEFDAKLNGLIEFGAKDRKTAFRWILQSYDKAQLDFYGMECVIFDYGLPYSMKPELERLAR